MDVRKSLNIGKEDLNANVLNNNICQPCMFVYIQPGTGQKCRSKHFT